MYSVYWIHEEGMLFENEGYVGITSRDPKERFKEHASGVGNKLLHNKIKKKEVILTVLYENLTQEEALSIEENLRPDEGIGWNFAKGGGLPPSRLGKVAESLLLTGESRTDKQKIASSRHSDMMKGKPSWNKGLTGFTQKREDVEKRAAKLRGVPKEIVTCPNCNRSGGKASMKRWHFEKCKFESGS